MQAIGTEQKRAKNGTLRRASENTRTPGQNIKHIKRIHTHIDDLQSFEAGEGAETIRDSTTELVDSEYPVIVQNVKNTPSWTWENVG